jgi:hypothetical protein
MSRERLPSRPHGVTDNAHWPIDGGRRIHVTAGYAPDVWFLEVFLRGGGRVGSETDYLLDDIAVVISRALQHGDTLASIAAGLGRLSEGQPASMIGAVVDLLHRIEVGAS